MIKKTISEIKTHKNVDPPLVVLTAYTAPMARILAPYVDIILVGDSLGMVLYGMDNTLDVSLDMMIAHGQAARRGAPDGFIVVDMPYGSYETSNAQALKNAQRIINETKCDAVKLEGGVNMADRIKTLVDSDIPVMAHIGLLPQSVEKEGGYKIKGRDADSQEILLEDVKAIEKAGAFAFVLEGTIKNVSDMVVQATSIPCIGIGASPLCDGQVLVTEDMVGLSGMAPPRFVKTYDDLGNALSSVIQSYAQDVRTRRFPDVQHTYNK